MAAETFEKWCKKCEALRPFYVSSRDCKACALALQATYRADPENKAKIKVRQAVYRAKLENKKKQEVYQAARYLNPKKKAKIKVQQAAYRAKPENKKKAEARRAAYDAKPENKTKAKVRQATRRMSPENRLTQLVWSAAFRAKAKKLPFGLDTQWIRDNLFRLSESCRACGRMFDLGLPPKGCHKNPRAPSIDQFVPKMGYPPENVRIICNQCNTAKAEESNEGFIAHACAIADLHRAGASLTNDVNQLDSSVSSASNTET